MPAPQSNAHSRGSRFMWPEAAQASTRSRTPWARWMHNALGPAILANLRMSRAAHTSLEKAGRNAAATWACCVVLGRSHEAAA